MIGFDISHGHNDRRRGRRVVMVVSGLGSRDGASARTTRRSQRTPPDAAGNAARCSCHIGYGSPARTAGSAKDAAAGTTASNGSWFGDRD